MLNSTKWTFNFSSSLLVASSLLFFSACTSAKTTPTLTGGTGSQTSIGGGGPAAANPAAAPSGAVARATSSTSTDIIWVDNSNDENGFYIYRSFNGNSGFNLVGTVTANITHYTDTQLFPGTTYYYQIKAFKAGVTTAATTASATTFTGFWGEVRGSATGGGLSNSATQNSSWPSVVNGAAGIMVVWQESVLGVDTIYALFYNPNVLDSATGLPVGWKPIIMNASVSSATNDGVVGPPAVPATHVTGVTYTAGSLQLSNTGQGLSVAAGAAQEPTVVYDSTNSEYDVFWQEKRNGIYGIYGRRVKVKGYNSLANGGNYYAQMSDSTITPNSNNVNTTPTLTNDFADDSYTTVASTWQLSAGGTTTAIHPQSVAAPTSGDIWTVWQNYDAASSTNWQVRGVRNTFAACAAYPDGSGGAAVAVTACTGPATQTAIDNAGVSNVTTGVSASVVAGEHAMYPTITMANAAGNNNIYVAWQQYVAGSSQWNINLKGCLNRCIANANSFAAMDNVVVNTGDSQHPKMTSDVNGLPYIAWDDNSYNNTYNIYVMQGTAAASPVFSTINDGSVSSGDTTTAGISGTAGTLVNTMPSISIVNTNIYVAWQAPTLSISPSVSNIYVKLYDSSVPTETAAWKGMADSDSGSGISVSTISAVTPVIRADSAGNVLTVWSQFVSGNGGFYEEVYLKNY